jgi:hypothetical protein
MKINVGVILKQDTEGRKTPLSIIWKDGRSFEIDRILDIRRAASLKAGGVGERYTCRVRNKQIYLFDEEGCWFMEG